MPPPAKNPLFHLIKKIRAECPADKVLVGCSGGKDSKTLAGVLQQADKHVVLMHVDHGLREESANEQKELSAWASQEGFEFIGVRLSLSSKAEGPARQARRKALLDEADRRGIACIALGHTARDQLETMLMRLARGTGLRGIGGIREITEDRGVTIYRPLLGIKQELIHTYLSYRGWVPIEDPSNESDIYTRNRFRKYVIPFFLRENRRVEENAHRMAEIFQKENEALEYYAEKEYERFIQNDCSLQLLGSLPEAIRRRVIILFWERNVKTPWKGQIGSKHVDSVLHIVETKKGMACLPGLVLKAHMGRLVKENGTRPGAKRRIHG